MNRSRAAGCGLLLLVVLAGCANPADDVTPAEVGEAKQSPAETDSAPDGAKSYVIDEASTIEFTGSKVTGSHDGGFEEFEGSFSIVDGQLVPNGEEIQIDMTSTWSDSDRLTGHLKNEDFFAVEEFPTSSFVITAIEPGESGSTVIGNLTLHGVTKSISFPADIEVADDKMTLKAEFFIKRFDFDIEYSGKADDLIRDEVVIRLDITASPENS